MIKFTIAIIFCATLFGCAGSCISLEGSYKDYKGGLTWCQDAKTSAEAQRDVLQNDSGEKAIILTEQEAATITTAITMQQPMQQPMQQNMQQVNIKSQTPFKNLIDFLKTKK